MNNCAIKDDYATLTIQRTFAADIDTVFNAWTTADVLAQWFGLDGVEVSSAKVDLQIGGQYEIIMQAPDGEVKHHGEYLQIEAPDKLIFTWVLDGQVCAGSTGKFTETLVTVDFKRMGDSTEVTLTHEQLPDKASCEGHQFGWTGCMDSLAKLLEK